MAKAMTPREAIIILDRLNTEERITVDRDELRAAVKVAKTIMQSEIERNKAVKMPGKQITQRHRASAV